MLLIIGPANIATNPNPTTEIPSITQIPIRPSRAQAKDLSETGASGVGSVELVLVSEKSCADLQQIQYPLI